MTNYLAMMPNNWQSKFVDKYLLRILHGIFVKFASPPLSTRPPSSEIRDPPPHPARAVVGVVVVVVVWWCGMFFPIGDRHAARGLVDMATSPFVDTGPSPLLPPQATPPSPTGATRNAGPA